MAFQEKELGQARENSTDAVSVYSPPVDIISTIITSVILCNTTGSAATYRLFHSFGGTTYDESTALFFTVSLAANSTIDLETFIVMTNPDGNFAYRTGTANAITISVYGAEIK